MSHPAASFPLLPIALAAGLCLAPAAFAQDRAEPGTTLDTITVTAAATATAVKDAPASLTVLTAEDIARVPATDLNEVLRRVPGLTQATTPDGGTSIQIRGLPQQYTLILVDGVRVGSSSETFDRYTRNELNWIAPEAIERIEVVRGPMSSLYGSDAMGGVINIITKKGGDTWGGQVSAGAEINPESIRGNDYSGGFNISGPLGKGFKLQLNGQQTYRQADSGLEDGTTAFRWGGGREGAKRQSLGARLDWDINDQHKLSLDVQRAEWKTLGGPSPSTSNPGGFAAAATTRGPSNMERESTSLTHQGKYSFGTSKLSLSHSKYSNETTAPRIENGQFVPVPGGTATQTYNTHSVSEDLILDGSVTMPFKWGFDQMLTVGAQWQRQELDNPNSVGSVANEAGVIGLSYKQAKSQALFVEDQIFLRDNLTLTLGLRGDRHDDYGSHISPRAYLVYHPTAAWTLRGGYSEGFRAPNLRQSNENFVSQSQGAGCGFAGYTGGGCSIRGNSDLKPETSQNWELGAAWEHEGWQAGLTFFNTDFKDKIDSQGIGYLPGGSNYWAQYVNIDSAITRGLEANLRVPLSRSITWNNSLTHMLKAENKTTGVALTTVSKWSGSSVLDWQVNSALGLSLGAELVGKQMGLAQRLADNSNFGEQRIQNSYVLYDLAANYRINKALRINAGVKNLFDRNASGNRDVGNNFYLPGRRFFATLTASF